MINYFCCNSF